MSSLIHHEAAVAKQAAALKHYNRIVFIVQGLLDRSEVFNPHPPIDFMDAADVAKWLVAIHDEEDGLPTSQPITWDAYRDSINRGLRVGDDVYARFDWTHRPRGWRERSSEERHAGVFRYEGKDKKGRAVDEGGEVVKTTTTATEAMSDQRPTTNDQRPTPETDSATAHRQDAYEFINPPEWEWVVPSDFARKLERERDEAREALQLISEREGELVAKLCYERDVNKDMRDAIKKAYDALYFVEDSIHTCVGGEKVESALAKLQPFLKP